MTMTATKAGKKTTPITISPEELQEKKEAAENGDRPVKIEVTKGKYFNNRLNIVYNRSWIKDDELTNEPVEVIKMGSEKGINMVHPDLQQAITLLKSHLLKLCDAVEAVDKTPDEMDKDFALMLRVFITEFKVEGLGDNRGVGITGHILNKRGKKRLLVAPFEKFYDEDQPYPFRDELEMVVDHLQNEARLYYLGKIAPSAPTLFDAFEGDEMNDHEGPNTDGDEDQQNKE